MIKFLEHMFIDTFKGWFLLITIAVILYLWILWRKENRWIKKTREGRRLRREERKTRKKKQIKG